MLKISQTSFVFLKKFNSEFQAIEVWFIDQNSQPLKIEDIINLTLVIKQYKCVIQVNIENLLKNYIHKVI